MSRKKVRHQLLEIETGQRYAVTTPEGVPLHFQIASAGSRFGAVILDYIIIVISLMVLIWMVSQIFSAWSGLGFTLSTIISFMLMHFYFTFFEVRWQGSTPGKRAASIRVINRSGGPVTGEAVVTRNFMRIIELFVPIYVFQMLLSDAMSGVPWYIDLLAAAWILILMFLPLLNKQRLRLGDMAAGTVVVHVPRAQLLSDVGETTAVKRSGRAAAFRFTRAQLDVYGEYELQVLEEVLRRSGGTRDAVARTLELVKDKIVRKIQWPERIPRSSTRAFLEAYYEALRAHREQRMLFGKRKADKHANEGMPKPPST